ncbi:MAG: zinc ribbon domain-containing protein [Collinsella sp.]
MSRYCASCGKLLADNAKFCTSCGAPVEQTTASDSQPAFEQTGSLDTPQAKADDPLAYRPDPAASPAAVETTQRIPVASGSPQQQPAPAYAPASPQTPAPKKSGTGPLIAVIVVLVAIIIALVVFFVIKPFDNAATQTTAEVAKLHHDVDDDDLKPLGDPNSLYDDDDDDDEDGGEATLSEQNLYRRLSEYYDSARRPRQPRPWLRAELQRQLSGRRSHHPSKSRRRRRAHGGHHRAVLRHRRGPGRPDELQELQLLEGHHRPVRRPGSPH